MWAEILGFFVACVLRDSKLFVLQAVEWCMEVPPASYLPAWVVEKSGERHSLRVRPRAAAALVCRLLRRYWLNGTLRKLTQWLGDASPLYGRS